LKYLLWFRKVCLAFVSACKCHRRSAFWDDDERTACKCCYF